MYVNGISNINFKANYFTVDKMGKYYKFTRISTDNEEHLGHEPVLEFYERHSAYVEPMTYDGKYYTATVEPDTDRYRIYYKDTGKYEKNGEMQRINPYGLANIAARADMRLNNMPLELSVSKGQAEGVIVAAHDIYSADIPKDKPVILVLDEIKDDSDIISHIPKSVKGVITASAYFGLLNHIANLSRNRYSVVSIVLDEDKFKSLKSQDGKYIRLDNEDGILKQVNRLHTPFKEEVPEKVRVPKLQNVERLLDFDELTPQNCGNKGYRLSLMQQLAEEGILKDITIPKGFVIPEGYINRYKEYVDIDDKEERKRRSVRGYYALDTADKIKELGLNRENLMIRSNYNTEDLGSFSSAGIYKSVQSMQSGSIMEETVYDVLLDLDDKLAKKVHKKYGIKESSVQPSVIIQDYIPHNYAFTTYSDDGDNNIIIELIDTEFGHLRAAPALIRYNKGTKKLSLEWAQSPMVKYLLDEKGNIVDEKHTESKVKENWEYFKPLFNIVAEGALVLEDFFNHPQDIEGGIDRDGKVYFWQTRDIVAKGKKKI